MHSTLPAALPLPVEHLAAGFCDVTNSYKVLLVLAMLAQNVAMRW